MKYIIYLLLVMACNTHTKLGGNNDIKKYAGGLARTPTLHLVIFANVNDKDQIISKGCQASSEAIQKLGKDIAQLKGNKLNPKVYTDKYSFTREMINNFQNDLTVGSDDIVFFYFIGHGYANTDTDKCNKLYPLLYMGNSRVNSPSPNETIALSTVHQRLKDKKPKLLFLLTDACQISANKSGLGGAGRASSEYNIQQLFSSSGSVVITACEPNQVAYINENGGIMTQKFIELISENGNATWKSLFDNLKKQVPDVSIKINGIERKTGQKPQKISCKQ